MEPACAKATATLTAMVLLPTPPLPLETAIIFFTPWIPVLSGIAFCWGISAVTSTVISVTPGKLRIAFLQSSTINSRKGQAGVVRTKVKLTLPPSIFYVANHI